MILCPRQKLSSEIRSLKITFIGLIITLKLLHNFIIIYMCRKKFVIRIKDYLAITQSFVTLADYK